MIAALIGALGLVLSGVILALVNVLTTREKYEVEVEHTEASAADLIQKAAHGSLMDMTKRLDTMEKELAQEKKHNTRLSARISSLEHNESENQTWIKSLEQLHEKLQRDHRDLQKQHNELQEKHNELQEKYNELSDTVEHSSRPDLGPAKDD